MTSLRYIAVFAAILLLVQAQKKGHRQRAKSDIKRLTEHKSARRSAAYNQEPSNALVLRTQLAPIGPPPQNPPVLDALDILRGRPPLTAKEAYDVLVYAQGGKDYPVYLEIPKTYFACGNVKPGFYADLDTYCQVYHRCDVGGKQSTFLCPTKTLFNQITLVCDWFYNVNCQNSRQFIEYSNSRLYYPQWQILDTQENYILPYTSAASGPPIQQQPIHHQQQQQPPPVLYPGKQQHQLYGSGNINGHENPEYQMSVVIRNPQMIPDYSVGESSLVNKELHMDQGGPTSATPAVIAPVDLGPSVQEQVQLREQAWRQQFRHEEEVPVVNHPSVNVTTEPQAQQVVVRVTQGGAKSQQEQSI